MIAASKGDSCVVCILADADVIAASKGGNQMRILAIETSCDETAIAILECEGDESSARFKILGNALLSQIEVHRPYGGVFPALAKREHSKNLIPVLEAALEEAEMMRESAQAIPHDVRDQIAKLLDREPGLAEQFFELLSEVEPPDVDAIAVTAGPGLEPALWVGINFAKALGVLWNKPLVAVNHMEGHVIAALASGNHVGIRKDANDVDSALAALASGNHVGIRKDANDAGAALASGNHAALPSGGSGVELEIKNVRFPVLALLISGGHTELVLMKQWLEYELVGQTRDDAVGEAFDKVARMLELPYPGGPEISKLAEELRSQPQEPGEERLFVLPRPMIHEDSCDFSFAGLKTAVLRLVKDRGDLTDADKKHLSHEFENAVGEVLWKKTLRAIDQTGAETLVIGGGVSANTHIRRVFTENVAKEAPHVSLRIPAASLTTDNAIMIGLAGYYRALREDLADPTTLKASGNHSLA